jgi:HD-GYP domain-containing protein (c-di-GMP phosphodiesterase class II)
MAVSAIRKELEKGRLDPKVVQALFELLQVSP